MKNSRHANQKQMSHLFWGSYFGPRHTAVAATKWLRNMQSAVCGERRMATFIQATRWATSMHITAAYNICVHWSISHCSTHWTLKQMGYSRARSPDDWRVEKCCLFTIMVMAQQWRKCYLLAHPSVSFSRVMCNAMEQTLCHDSFALTKLPGPDQIKHNWADVEQDVCNTMCQW